VPNRVDADVKTVEPADCYPVVDRSAAEAEFQELAPSDYAVLPTGNGCDRPVIWST
jgi:hypothetical protein